MAFEALDRIYAHEGAASSAELRRWAADSRNAQRAALALFYLGPQRSALEQEPRKAASFSANSWHNIRATFLPMRRAPSFLLLRLPRDRAQEALQTAQAGQGFRNSFVRGQAQAALGEYKQAAASFLQAAGASELEMAALENSAVCALLAGVPEAENRSHAAIGRQRPDFAPTVDRIRFFEAMRQASNGRSATSADLLRKIAESDSVIRATRKAGACGMGRYLQLLRAGRPGRHCVASPADDPATKERTDYLAIFVGDDGDRESEAQIAKLAESLSQRTIQAPRSNRRCE